MKPIRIFFWFPVIGLFVFGTAIRCGNRGPVLLDLSEQIEHQSVVDREEGQYLGHPTTVLLNDGRTILAVYPKGHGRGPIVLKRSTDGGRNWSDRLSTPKSWETSLETPTIHEAVDSAGMRRLVLFSGLFPIRESVSEDGGWTWSELKPIGDFGGIVAMSGFISLRTGPGHYLAMFHDDGRFLTPKSRLSDPPVFTLFQTFSRDGGLTWSLPDTVFSSGEIHLCEPGIIRSPDGKQIAVLLRENTRKKNSHAVFSKDEGRTWTAPRELPAPLTGDRHTGRFAPDGRLLVSFRDVCQGSPFLGDWVAWVGTYNDLIHGREGQYRIRLMDNTESWDCGYPGVEVLEDGSFVLTSYGHWIKNKPPYIVSVRLTLPELDRMARSPMPSEAEK